LLITYDLSIDQKMELYYTCTEGRLDDFRNLVIKKKYSILEEISYKNYYWTPLHYAMHYGQFEIIKFILDHLKDQNIIEPALRLQSSDGRCPILCLLKSNHLSDSRKEELFEKLLKNYYFSITKEIKREALTRGFEKTLKRYGKL
jgi:ankyrin repeat protein